MLGELDIDVTQREWLHERTTLVRNRGPKVGFRQVNFERVQHNFPFEQLALKESNLHLPSF